MRTEPSPRQDYIAEVFAREDDLLRDIRAALKADGKDGIQISAGEGKILHFLIRSLGLRKVVEVGTLYGYSTLWLARAVGEGGQVITLEKEIGNHRKAGEFFARSEVAKRIQAVQGDALEILPTLQGPVDLVFIDANKSGYIDYLDWAESVVRPGGLIIGDNTFLFGHVWLEQCPPDESPAAWKAMREFNRRLADPTRYHSVLLPTLEGMTVAQVVAQRV